MSDQPKPEPRIDEHGVGICTIDCPIWKECMAACSITTDNRGVCLPWARKAAEALKAMEAVRQNHSDIWWMEKLQVFRVINDGSGKATFLGEAPDPADAILKAVEAAEAAEKGGVK